MTQHKNYFNDDESFTGADGFNVAFAMLGIPANYSSEAPWSLLDESYGSFKVFTFEWDLPAELATEQ